ncbi:hypothetical protein EDB83DRAFT_2178271, partial [Lactarius deliciosus]
LSLDLKRRRADDQMRDHFRNLHHSLVTPRLPGVSTFGNGLFLRIYTLDDVAPIERWNCDLLEDEGINRIRQVAQDVKAMCQA